MAGSTDQQAAEALNVAHEISKILDCGLDKDTLAVCISLIEAGVNPEALAEVIKRLRKQAGASQQAREQQEQQQCGGS